MIENKTYTINRSLRAVNAVTVEHLKDIKKMDVSYQFSRNKYNPNAYVPIQDTEGVITYRLDYLYYGIGSVSLNIKLDYNQTILKIFPLPGKGTWDVRDFAFKKLFRSKIDSEDQLIMTIRSYL